MECKVRWALGSITMNKASGGDGVSVELFQILKEDAVKVVYSIGQQIWKTWMNGVTGMKRVSFHFNPKERQCQRMFKLLTIALISHTSKVMLRILQARLQQYMNRKLPHVQAGFRKVRGTRDQVANIPWITVKAREFQKNIYFCFIDYAKAFVWITINCGKFL